MGAISLPLITDTSSARCFLGVLLLERRCGAASHATVVNLRKVLNDCRVQTTAERGRAALAASEEVLR
jgi:hypothetical protein